MPSTQSLRSLCCALALCWLAACQFTPSLRYEAKLIDIAHLEPGIRLDIRYATPNNFTGRVLYSRPRALLLEEPAAALIRAHRSLAPLGYGIVIYDAYRPWRVTQSLWDSASESDRRNGYVANPALGSRHNRACAVDVGLYELGTGQQAVMPSDFDDFTERAHADWAGGTAKARHHRELLRHAMQIEHFTVLANEWWHFNYRDCDHEPVLDIPFEAMNPASR